MAEWADKPQRGFLTRDLIDSRPIEKLTPYVDHEFTDRLPIDIGMNVLDVGFLKGRDLRRLWARHPSCRLVGVDIEPRLVEWCRKTHADTHIEFFHADVMSLPFKDGEFDVVYANGLLKEVSDKSMAIAEMMRVGKQVYLCDTDDQFNFTYETY